MPPPKPIGVPALNLDDPMTRGLVFYGLDTGNGNIVDLVGHRAAIYSSQPAPTVSPFGQALKWNNVGSVSFASDPRIRGAQTSLNFSFATAWYQTTNSGSFQNIFSRRANNGGSPYANWDIEFDIGGGTNTVIAQVLDNGGHTSMPTWSGHAVNVFESLVGVVSSATSGAFYAQGALVGTQAFTNVQDNDTGDQIYFGKSFDNTPYAFIYYGGLWNRVLTPSEILRLHVHPWCMLNFPKRRLIERFDLQPPAASGQIFMEWLPQYA